MACANTGFTGKLRAETGKDKGERMSDKDTPWQPIETAPKDGTVVLVIDARHDDDYPYPAHWKKGYGWFDPGWDGGYSPTHWMPLPDPPNTTC